MFLVKITVFPLSSCQAHYIQASPFTEISYSFERGDAFTLQTGFVEVMLSIFLMVIITFLIATCGKKSVFLIQKSRVSSVTLYFTSSLSDTTAWTVLNATRNHSNVSNKPWGEYIISPLYSICCTLAAPQGFPRQSSSVFSTATAFCALP